MENNEISMFMDVKLDIPERKKETVPFKSWTKCLVKIEAVKCFPCYFRITFTRDVENISDNLYVRINIPGITARQATSRTKNYSYGVFWKQNRKRCCIFFALETQLSFDRHMKWFQKSIQNLELHRHEILETKRISRYKLEPAEDGMISNNKSEKNLQDILGPLPQIPDVADSNWSARASEFSGIYEEIQDGEIIRRVSRASVASGIYEEMKLPTNFETIRESNVSTPPPLPPRKRVNTFHTDDETVHRSYTNPETELAKKKKYLTVLENMFGRSKRCESISEGKVSTAEELYAPDKPTYNNVSPLTSRKVSTSQESHSSEMLAHNNVTPRIKRKEICIDLDKRNSFSSPDLSKITKFNGQDELDDLISFSSDLQVLDLNDSSSLENFNFMVGESFKDLCNEITDDENDCILNVSASIQPNFNFSFNSSTINLVGSNLNPEKTPIAAQENVIVEKAPPNVVIDDISGYCIMAPIFKTNPNMSLVNSDKQNEDNETTQVPVNSVIYENMNVCSEVDLNNCSFQESLHSRHKCENSRDVQFEDEEENPENSYLLVTATDADVKQSPGKITNFDDKIPSYYPNTCGTLKGRKRNTSGAVDSKSSTRKLEKIKINRNENVYMSSPQRKAESKSRESKSYLKVVTPLRIRKLGENINSTTRNGENIENIPQHNKVVSISIENVKNNDEITRIEESSPRIYQKYATLARISPNKYLEKCAKKTTDLGAVKKFASLPRFKKIDFSPLKIKINNVLQRHQSDGF